MNELPQKNPTTTQEAPLTSELLLPQDDSSETSEKNTSKSKPIVPLIILFIVVVGAIGYSTWQKYQMKSKQKTINFQSEPTQPIEEILKEIEQLGNFKRNESEWKNIANWQKIDRGIRLHKIVGSKYLYTEGLDSLEKAEELYNRITAYVKENSFTIDPTRVGVLTSSGGSRFISNEMWTNGSELILINFYEGLGDPKMFSIEIYSLGDDLELIEEIEKKETEILNEYFKLSYYDNSGSIWESVRLSENNDIVAATKIFSDSNQDRYFTWIDAKSREASFLYYGKDAETNTIKGIFSGNFTPGSMQCDDFKQIDITQNEIDKIRTILEEADYGWYVEELQDCHFDD